MELIVHRGFRHCGVNQQTAEWERYSKQAFGLAESGQQIKPFWGFSEIAIMKNIFGRHSHATAPLTVEVKVKYGLQHTVLYNK